MVRLTLLLMLAAVACCPLDTHACDIIYGDDWALVSQVPPGWTEGCGPDALAETNLTLWPQGQTVENASALIYVTVSDKGEDSLSTFVADELRRFKEESPARSSMVLDAPVDVSPTRKLVHIARSTGGRDEVIEYLEGPTAFYIVVLTSASPEVTKKYKPAFDLFLSSLSPASATQGDG